MAGPTGHFLRFLGLHWGQFPEEWEIKKRKAPSAHGAAVSADEDSIKGMSGMTLAVPAWDILEFLKMPQFEEERRRELETLRNALNKDDRISSRPVAESADQDN